MNLAAAAAAAAIGGRCYSRGPRPGHGVEVVPPGGPNALRKLTGAGEKTLRIGRLEEFASKGAASGGGRRAALLDRDERASVKSTSACRRKHRST